MVAVVLVQYVGRMYKLVTSLKKIKNMVTAENLLLLVKQSLQLLLQPDRISQGEVELKNLENEKDFKLVLISISIQQSIGQEAIQAAIYLKNYLLRPSGHSAKITERDALMLLEAIQKSTITKPILLSAFSSILSRLDINSLFHPISILLGKDYFNGFWNV
jgi:hypothetical protein